MTFSQLRKILKPLGYSLHRGENGYYLKDLFTGEYGPNFDSLYDLERYLISLYE